MADLDPFSLSLQEESGGSPNSDTISMANGPVNIAPVDLPTGGGLIDPRATEGPVVEPRQLSADSRMIAEGQQMLQNTAQSADPATGEFDSVLLGMAGGAAQPFESTGQLILNTGLGALQGQIQHRQAAAARQAQSQQQAFENQMRFLEVAGKLKTEAQSDAGKIFADHQAGLLNDDQATQAYKQLLNTNRRDNGAQSPVGKIESDFRSGRITKEQRDAALAKANSVTRREVTSSDIFLASDKDQVETIMENRATAIRQTRNLDVFQSNLSRFTTGSFGNTRIALGALARYAGIDVKALGLDGIAASNPEAGELVDSIGKDLAREAMAAAKGNLNQREFEFFTTSYPRVSATIEGNVLMIQLLRRNAEFDINKAEFLDQWRAAGNTSMVDKRGNSFESAWARHAEKTLPFVKVTGSGIVEIDASDIQDKFKQVMKNSPSPGAPIVQPQSLEDRMTQIESISNPTAAALDEVFDEATTRAFAADRASASEFFKNNPAAAEAFVRAVKRLKGDGN